MEFIHSLIDFILHIDQHLVSIVNEYQTWTYLILFFIIFAETGFVVTPFLPGDSLLFAIGALIARGDTNLNGYLMLAVLCLAAILGNTLNYFLGIYLGKKIFKPHNRILKLEYYQKTQSFFEEYGAKAVILSRFLPIFRTVAPFVAGVGHMPFKAYTLYNIIGGVAWTLSLVLLGYWFGNIPIIKHNFSLVAMAIIIISLLPSIYAAFKPRKVNN